MQLKIKEEDYMYRFKFLRVLGLILVGFSPGFILLVM
jgi:hypothetical protein